MFEIRSSTTPIKLDGNKLTGTAIPYNSDSHDLGGFVERFEPGAVTDTIKSNMIEAWHLHERTMPLGSQHAGTLRLREDDKGLHYEIDLPDTTYANDLRALMKSKDIGGTSFGFRVTPGDANNQRWTKQNGMNLRIVRKADLEHISPVITPAYPQTTAILRSLNTEDKAAVDYYGIDVRQLDRLLVSIANNLPIENEERDFATSFIDKLSKSLIVPTPNLAKALENAKRILI